MDKLSLADWTILGATTLLGIGVRCFRIAQPPSVVWDEIYFVRFAGQYIQRRFFFDVHPPLGKLCIALVAWMAGFDGNFSLRGIGDSFATDGVPYVSLRLISALCGALLVPVTYGILRASQCHSLTATMGACLVVFENALLTTSRLILLDSLLILGIALTALSWIKFQNHEDNGLAFHRNWWFWLISTGLCLGTTLSIKWVGAFTVAWVGLSTMVQLYQLLSADDTTIMLWLVHFVARLLCLAISPLSVYTATFHIHFRILQQTGPGDRFMSHAFQSTLTGNNVRNISTNPLVETQILLQTHADPHRLGFFRKFLELQYVMWIENANLTNPHEFGSRPWTWPILRRGIGFWAQDHRLIHLFGNPLIWWSGTAAVTISVLFAARTGICRVAGYRRYRQNSQLTSGRINYTVLAWAIHFFPFFFMRRQLYLHHYLPALFFSIITLCQIFDTVVFSNRRGSGRQRRQWIGFASAVTFVAAGICIFYLYSPMAYGNAWTRTECQRYKVLRTWDWKCHWFRDNI